MKHANWMIALSLAASVLPALAAEQPAAPGATETAPDGSLALRRKNLLKNASFEWNDYEGRGIRSGQAADWYMWGKGYGTYSDRSVPYLPSEPTHGTRSQRIAMNFNGREQLQFLQSVRGIAPKLPYTFSADVKVDAPDELEVALTLAFYAGAAHRESKTGPFQSPTSFQRISFSAVAPDGVDQIRATYCIRPKKENARGTFWTDAAQLEQSAAPTPFVVAYEAGPAEHVAPPIDLQQCGDAYRFSWHASQPAGAELRFQFRSADTAAALAAAPWRGPRVAEFYAAHGEVGDNLIAEPALDKVVDDHSDKLVHNIGYGDNDRKFSVLPDGRDGRKALRVQITRHAAGNGRWMLASKQIEPDTEYCFGAWHREGSAGTPVDLSVNFEDAKGQVTWSGGVTQRVDASTNWKRDTLLFRTPKTVGPHCWVQVCLSDNGSITTEGYTLRRVAGGEDWGVNPVHRGQRFIQYRAIFSTTDSSGTPRLYRAGFQCGKPVPEVRWLNVLAADGNMQKYSFEPGQTAVFKPQVMEFSGEQNIASVELALKDPVGKERLRANLERAEALGEEERAFTGRYAFASDAPAGEWQAVVTARNRLGGSTTMTSVLKVRPPYAAPPQRMLLGAIVTDYGFARHKGEALQKVLATYRSCAGLDLWKLSFSLSRLEPRPGEFDPDVVEGLKAFIAAAHAAGVKAQIAIQQQDLPEWFNNGQWDSRDRYRFEQTRLLADTWARLATALRGCEGLDSYLLINEENAVYDADVYLRSMMRVASAVRAADPDLHHRITLRPNTRDPYIRTRVATDGAQDYDYGSGGYPTHPAWYFKQYASPVSVTAMIRMATQHESPLVYGGPGGVGEIGYFHRHPPDAFGDDEKLAGYKLVMRMSYELGADEFVCWSDAFSFERPDVYYRKLADFRDELVRKPRPSRLDVRVVVPKDERLVVGKKPDASEVDPAAQPFLGAVRYLDEHGYVWYFTSPQALAIQRVTAAATIDLAEFKGLSVEEQEKRIADRLREVKPSGTPMAWPR